MENEQRPDRNRSAAGNRARVVWPVHRSKKHFGRERPGSQGGVVPGRYRFTAPLGFNSQPGRNGERIRAAGSHRIRRYREGAVSFAFGADSLRQDCRQRATGWRARPAAGGGGKLSAAEVERKFYAPAGGTGGNGKPHRGGARAL